jgi:hypothetical protein
MTGSHEVDGSIPFSSTKDFQGVIYARSGGDNSFFLPQTDAGYFLAGQPQQKKHHRGRLCPVNTGHRWREQKCPLGK